MKSPSLLFFTALALLSNSQATVVISENFSSVSLGADLNGTKGWVVNDTKPYLANVNYWSTGGGKAAFLGFGYKDEADNFMPTLPTVNLAHSYGERLVSSDNVGTSVTFNFGLEDSTAEFPNRDTFGISLTTTGGANIFSVTYTPYAPNPGVWSVSYTVGAGPSVYTGWGLQAGPYSNDFDLQFAAAGSTTTYSLTINDHTWTGTTAFSPSTVINTFGVSWTPLMDPTIHPDQAGYNGFIFDNLEIIPEPSSALLFGMAGLGLAMRRRRA